MPDVQYITDIHTHVLPGVDDGPTSLDDARRLLDAHKQAGTHRIFCTSHLGSPHFNNTELELSEAFHTLSTSLGALNEVGSGSFTNDEADRLETAASTELTAVNSPELSRGAEVRVTPTLTDLILQNEVPTLGQTSYVLLEYPNSELNERMLDVVHELRVRGFRPIMAHPERNIVIQKDPDFIDTVLETGMLLQLTASCFEKVPTGRSHMADKLAWTILEKGAAAVIASDAHDPAYRPPGLLKAYETIAERLGAEVADALIANANAVWEDQPISSVPVQKRKRGLFRR